MKFTSTFALISFSLMVFLGATSCQKNKPDPGNSDTTKKQKADKSGEPGKTSSKAPDTAIGKSIHYLFSKQHEDGLWRSENYGNLKSGAGISALILYAISQAEPGYWQGQKPRLQKCADVLSSNIRKHGYVANADGPDYSNYGSAYLILALQKLDLDFDPAIRNQLVEYLVDSQLDEAEGFTTEKDDFGGWDLTGWMTGKRPTTGTNISVSSAVLMALKMERDHLLSKKPNLNEYEKKQLDSIETCFEKARVWLKKCRNESGGFFFHPEQVHHGNKAGWLDEDAKQARAYGTATLDGLHAIQCLKPARSETWDRYHQQAMKWLKPHPGATLVPGFQDADSKESWAVGLRFYFWMRLAQSEIGLSETLEKHIQSLQKADGRWENPNARMREDDPLIATAFLTIALSAKKQAP